MVGNLEFGSSDLRLGHTWLRPPARWQNSAIEISLSLFRSGLGRVQ
jgi:hypothetical protein